MTPTNDGLQVRYVELRFDGNNVIEGTLMRYGDTATLPWNEKERFEAGAFGTDVASQDLSLNIQHMRDQKIARTGGAGLTFTDSVSALDLRAELDIEDPDAQRALRKVKKGIIRGLSIEFMPLKERLEGTQATGYTTVIERAELRGAGLVDSPAYPQSTLREQQERYEQRIATLEGNNMPLTDEQKAEMRALMIEAWAQRDADATAQDANATAIATAVRAAFQQFRDDDLPDIVAVAIAAATPEPATVVPPDDATPPADGDPPPDDDGGRAATFDAEVQARADLIVQVQPLMPKDYDFAGKTRSEILVAAAGDEVPNAAERSDDYLHAKVEGILERRANVQGQRQDTTQRANENASGVGPVNLTRMIEQKRQAATV